MGIEFHRESRGLGHAAKPRGLSARGGKRLTKLTVLQAPHTVTSRAKSTGTIPLHCRGNARNLADGGRRHPAR